MRILMVEDETMFAEAISQVLKKNNYSIDLAFDGEYGLDCALSAIYDMIILDIMLPKRDGLNVLQRIREAGISTPVILLTAKGELEDKVRGLDCGADDYLPKPFRTEELLARLRALARRKSVLHCGGLLHMADITLDPHLLVLSKAAAKAKLTLKESQALELLMANAPMTTAKETIIEKLWGYETEAQDNHVEIHVSLLRKKLKQIGSCVVIKAIRGVGYALYNLEGEN